MHTYSQTDSRHTPHVSWVNINLKILLMKLVKQNKNLEIIKLINQNYHLCPYLSGQNIDDHRNSEEEKLWYVKYTLKLNKSKYFQCFLHNF